jgi:hypothetical protein
VSSVPDPCLLHAHMHARLLRTDGCGPLTRYRVAIRSACSCLASPVRSARGSGAARLTAVPPTPPTPSPPLPPIPMWLMPHTLTPHVTWPPSVASVAVHSACPTATRSSIQLKCVSVRPSAQAGRCAPVHAALVAARGTVVGAGVSTSGRATIVAALWTDGNLLIWHAKPGSQFVLQVGPSPLCGSAPSGPRPKRLGYHGACTGWLWFAPFEGYVNGSVSW